MDMMSIKMTKSTPATTVMIMMMLKTNEGRVI